MICMPIGKPACVKPHGTLIAGMPKTLNGSVLRINEPSRAGFASTAAIVSGSDHARRGDEHVDVGEHVADRVARDGHAPTLLDVRLSGDVPAVHDSRQRQRLIKRALRRVGDQRRVIRVRLGVEQRIGVRRRDLHVASRAAREIDEDFERALYGRVDLGIELLEERRARNADAQRANVGADRRAIVLTLGADADRIERIETRERGHHDRAIRDAARERPHVIVEFR